MGKILFTLELPEPEIRKIQAPPVKKHKNKKLYSRKVKHKKSPVPQGTSFGSSHYQRAVLRSFISRHFHTIMDYSSF